MDNRAKRKGMMPIGEYMRNDYTVGWVCALPKEQMAATAMLDQRHPDLPKPPNDPNTYTLGSIGGHNIVIACLPKGKIGTISTASVVTNMIYTFPFIRFGLMVGIGGGVPPYVRLGDVVVGIPSDQYPGVVQWDVDTTEQGGSFRRKGALKDTPNLLLTALARLETNHDFQGTKIPGDLQDILFKPDYDHVEQQHPGGTDNEAVGEGESEEGVGENCPHCDRAQVVQRKSRDMLVHYGLIASGNQVIKDARTRDQLSMDFGRKVLCIDMEAATLMENFPCIVIRGICDYADSHRNKAWQEHAAAMAAAFGKELLGHVIADDVRGEKPVNALFKIISQTVTPIREETTRNTQFLIADASKMAYRARSNAAASLNSQHAELTASIEDSDSAIDTEISAVFSADKPTEDNDDNATDYPYTSEKSNRIVQKHYDAYFASKLFQHVSQFETGGDISKLSQGLPKLLQAFARRLGFEDSKQANRDIMRYVHKHRMSITQSFHQKRVQSIEDDLPPAFAEYQHAIENSSAYHWLRSKLEHDLLHSISGDPYISMIGDAVFDHDIYRRVSRKSPPAKCIVEYVVDWNLLDFIQSQGYSEAPEDVVVQALTVTGSPIEAEALTCGNYIQRTWPQSGNQFLRLLQELVVKDRGTRLHVMLDDGTTIEASMRKTDFLFKVAGQPDTVVEVGEQIQWISCTLRSSNIQGAVVCVPILRKVIETGRTERSISFTMELTAEVASANFKSSDQGCCWRSLFRSPLLVQGYPVARRSDQSTPGMEMSLAIIMALTRTQQITLFKHNLFVKGHYTMLVAVKEVNDVVLWHVLSNEDEQYIEYHDKRVHDLAPGLDNPTVVLDLLPEKRHIVGWWPLVQIQAGTLHANLDIRGSGVEAPGKELIFERFTLGVSKFAMASASIALGERDQLIKIEKDEDFYHNKIERALQRYVVFYDTADQRAWLLDGATALLHLTRASLHAKEKHGFAIITKNEDIQEKEGPQETSAVRTLTDPSNMKLKLFEEYVGEVGKAVTKRSPNTPGDPKPEISVTKNTKSQLFKDQVESIYKTLDILFAHQSDMSPNGVGLGLSRDSLRKLEGFDFIDVAAGETRLHPKLARLESEELWLKLLRRLRAVTLFGKGFGNILEPLDLIATGNTRLSVCSAWSQVPPGHNYLAVSNITLRRIMSNTGGTSHHPLSIARDL
ncbi:hypothetical protein E8E14_005558 [Neopestalotiopsis sp. 37M]|nr:hypothetical protein E8E14_005558 [Neopestalotiopsis sp. 37M]